MVVMIISLAGLSQTSTQNFGTGTGSQTSQTGSTLFLPNPTSGTTWARGGATAPNAPIVLSNTSNPLGTAGSYVRAVASSSTSVAKLSPWVGYTGGTEFYTSFKILFGDASAGSTATTGSWSFYQGAGAMYSDASDFAGAQVFTGLRFTYGVGGAITLTYRGGSNFINTGLTQTTFSSATIYTIEIVGNNKTSGTINYSYNGGAQSVAVQKFDLYINGTLIGDDLAEALLPANTSVTSGTFIGISSTSNAANIFVDDAVTYNAVPSSIGIQTPTTTSISPSSATEGTGGFTLTVNGTNFVNGVSTVRWNGTNKTTTFVNNTQLTAAIDAADIATAGSATVTVLNTGNPTESNGQTFTINPAAAPTKLVITSVSPASPTVNSPFSVTVQSQDNSNIPQNVGSNVTVNLSRTAGTGTLGGTLSGTINAGTNSVTFTGLTYNVAESGVELTAADGAAILTSGTITFAVQQAASQLAFVGVPASGTPGVNLSSFTVEARRPDNSVDNTYTGNITISKASGPGTLSGTTTVAAVAGIATFSTLQFDQAGTYTLDAAAAGLTGATSGTITIVQPPVTWNFGTASGNAAPSGGVPVSNLAIGNISQGNNNGTTTLLTTTSPSSTSDYPTASGQYNAGAAAFVGALNVNTSTYFEFTLTPAADYSVTLNAISFGSRSTGTGPAAFSVRSSLDGYNANVATGSLSTSSIWVLNTPSTTSTTSLTGTPVTFRIYGHSGTGSPSAGTANWRIDDLSISVEVKPSPTITSFTPTSGYSGTSVVITGTNFSGTTAVTFGGSNVASFTVDNATQITATVGAGTSGVVSVTTPNGTGVSSNNFTYNGYITNANGNWNSGSTWLGGNVPPSNSDVTLAHDISFDVAATLNSLTLNNGIISLGNNNLSVMNVIGGASSSYIKTNGTGTLTVNNITTSKSLPVGNAAYNPLLIENGSGHNWSARVIDGLTASPGYNTDRAVLLQWDITPSVNPPAGGADITFQFNQGTQVGPLFNTGTSVQAWRNPLDAGWVTAGSPTAVTVVNGTTSTVKVTGLSGFSKYALSNIDGPLPVSLLSFSGYKDGSRNQLSWTTASEMNNRGFEVQRSTDGVNYTAIGFVSSLATGGNSNDQLNYHFSDNTPAGVKQYYRLRQEDIDGRSKLSNIVLINGAKPSVIAIRSLFPNPASATASMIVDAPSAAKLAVLVTDMAGRNMVQQIVNVSEGSNTVSLNISSLQSGTYLLRVMSEEGEVVTGKLVKQ